MNVWDSEQHAGSSKSVCPLRSSSMQLPQISRGKVVVGTGASRGMVVLLVVVMVVEEGRWVVEVAVTAVVDVELVVVVMVGSVVLVVVELVVEVVVVVDWVVLVVLEVVEAVDSVVDVEDVVVAVLAVVLVVDVELVVVDSSSSVVVVVVLGRGSVVVVLDGGFVVLVVDGFVVEVVGGLVTVVVEEGFVVDVVDGFVVVVVDCLVVVVVDGLSQPCFRMITFREGSRTCALIARLQTCAAQLTNSPWFRAGQHSSSTWVSVSASPSPWSRLAWLEGTARTSTKASALATIEGVWNRFITRAL